MLKRRSSSVLDEGLTLGGPIRSTRQKTIVKKPVEMEKQSVSLAFELLVPRQSRETARKILERLERDEPFPKEKSRKAQLAIARAESPSRLNMNDDVAVAEAVSTLPLQISSPSSEEPLASSFKRVSASRFSENLTPVSSSNGLLSTSTVSTPTLGIPVVGGPVSSSVFGIENLERSFTTAVTTIRISTSKGFRIGVPEESDDEEHNDSSNRKTWSPEEDSVLTECIRTHGEGNWASLPIKAGLKRRGKSCRLRWFNYLYPNIKRKNFLGDELIIRLHRLLGSRWSLIAKRLPGRTDNDVKNYWNAHLCKKLRGNKNDPSQHPPNKQVGKKCFWDSRVPDKVEKKTVVGNGERTTKWEPCDNNQTVNETAGSFFDLSCVFGEVQDEEESYQDTM